MVPISGRITGPHAATCLASPPVPKLAPTPHSQFHPSQKFLPLKLSLFLPFLLPSASREIFFKEMKPILPLLKPPRWLPYKQNTIQPTSHSLQDPLQTHDYFPDALCDRHTGCLPVTGTVQKPHPRTFPLAALLPGVLCPQSFSWPARSHQPFYHITVFYITSLIFQSLKEYYTYSYLVLVVHLSSVPLEFQLLLSGSPLLSLACAHSHGGVCSGPPRQPCLPFAVRCLHLCRVGEPSATL